MNEFFDDTETRDPEERERELFVALSNHIQHAKKKSQYFNKLLREVQPQDITNRASLAKLPITRKSDLVNIQSEGTPLGGLNAISINELRRIFQSPGPTYDAEGNGADWWGTARALFAAGFQKGDIVHNSFSYHFTPAGVMLETGASALGCPVFPAGVGNSELQVQAIHNIKPKAYVGTPSFLKILIEKSHQLNKDTSSIKKACVGGEALPDELRQYFESRGVRCTQIYASADLGNIAYESKAREGLIVDERLLIEIVRPGTGHPVDEGEVGEVVATLFRPEYPLIRFATGDLSAILPGRSPCGRTNIRLAGWKGRADQTTKVKGMFVHPAQIAQIVSRHAEIKKARLVVSANQGTDTMNLKFESDQTSESLVSEIINSIHAVCKLKGYAERVDLNSLPNDGKVIDDIRQN